MSGDFQFRLATMADAPALRAFMRAHWGAPHPLIELEDFFAYYYKGEGDALHFALCERDGKLAAIAGYIPASLGPGADVWVSIWVADKAAQGSGLELMAELPRLTGCRTLACNNIRPETRPFYHFLGYETGRMGHFYRLADKDTYLLAKVAEKDILPVGGDAALVPLEDAEALRQSGFVPPRDANPYKDLWYIARRYFAYPRQSYHVYGVVPPGQGVPAALLCTRTVRAAGTAVLRIADVIGPPEALPRAGAAIDGLMQAVGAEYADLYCAGVDADLLRKAGFAERGEDSPNVIPNYLDPPLRENTDYYYFTSRPAGFTLFKADGDQDRPNIPMD